MRTCLYHFDQNGKKFSRRGGVFAEKNKNIPGKTKIKKFELILRPPRALREMPFGSGLSALGKGEGEFLDQSPRAFVASSTNPKTFKSTSVPLICAARR
jgi:hypothetical protein